MRTNTQRVMDFMNFSKHGALSQAFVIEAISRYAAEIVKNEQTVLKQMETHMIHGPSWVGVAKEWVHTAELWPETCTMSQFKDETGLEGRILKEAYYFFTGRMGKQEKPLSEWWKRNHKLYAE